MRNQDYLAVLAAAFFCCWNATAGAYPTAVLRTPTGDTKGFLDLNVMIASSFITSPPQQINAQRSTTFYPGATRVAFTGGFLPSFAYTEGINFGGLEAGVDFLTNDSFGTSRVKPVFSTKLSLLTESTYLPYVGVGLMEVSTLSHQSLNFGYLSLTKTLRRGTTSYGRITIGLARTFAPLAQRYAANCPAAPESVDACMFRGTFPFADASPYALLFGYESPRLGPLLFAFDHTGGYSSVSSTNVGLKLFMSDRINVAVVRFYGNVRDRDTLRDLGAINGKPTAGLIVGISATADVVSLFRPKPEPPSLPPARSRGLR